MPLNIRAKASHSKLTAAAAKSGGQNDGNSSHSRFSRSTKQGKGKQAVSSGPGSRSGLEPGSVSGGGPPPAAKQTGAQGSVSKLGPRLKVNTSTADKGSTRGSATAPGGKTMSMENIQSLSAAYATSGTMYPNERESLEPSGGYPKSTMTLGRSTSRSSSTGRSTAIRSTPNITASGMHHIPDSCGDQTVFSTGTSSLRRQSGRCTQTLDLNDRGEVSTCDLQAQLRDLQRENESLRRELDGGRDGKTGPGMNSVNFWSPDVKRDKGSRREEGVRTPALKEQCRVNQEDLQLGDIRRNKQLPLTVQELQEELRAHRETNSRLRQQRQQSSSYREHHMDQEYRGGLSPGHSPRQSSINLHSPAPRNSPKASPSNTYNPRQQEADIIIHSPGYGCNTLAATQRLSPANTLQLGQRNSPSQLLYSPSQGALPSSSPRHPCSPCQVPGCDGFSSPPPQDPTEENFFRLQSEHDRQANELSLLRKTMEEMEMRIDSQKQTLGARDESIQRLLEMLQGQGQCGRGQRTGITTMAAQEADAHLENVHLREIEQLKQELNRKDSEMQALQTKLETLTNQNSDYKQHIEVLKESLSAKEQRANTLQTEVDALRVRLEEKEQILTKKTKQLQDLSDEKSTLAGEIRDMKDMLDVKERKVNILQKKIENLLEQLKDKDKQLAGLRERVQGLQTDSSNTDTALATLEEALSEKERVIENLRDLKEREDRVRLEEMDQMRRENQELKEKLAALQPSKLSQSQVTNSILIQNQRPDGEVEPKVDGFPAVNPTTPKPEETVRICPDIADRLRLLEQEVARYREESGKSQAEVERLKGALKDAEVDKSCKEKKITDLERPGQIKSPNIQKQIVPGEMRRDALVDGHPHSLSQLEELMGALEKTRQELDATKVRLSSTQKCLHERDGHLNQLRQDRRKQLEEIMEMKQQALLAAISEKDANIALLELSSSKRKKAQEEVMALKREKDRLMHQLKQQTQSRMKLIADNYEEDYIYPQHHPHHLHHMHTANLHHRSVPRGDPHANHRPPMDQDDEEGIWA